MPNRSRSYILIRQLTASDLGWFAEPRRSGQVASKQRAININTVVVSQILSPTEIASAQVTVRAKCVYPHCDEDQVRPLSKIGKNWRLGGPKVSGVAFRALREGDFWISHIEVTAEHSYCCYWTVVMAAESPDHHNAILETYGPQLVNRMLCMPISTESDDVFQKLITEPGERQVNEKPSKGRAKQSTSIRERLQQPHILQEMMRTALSLSARAQQDFLVMLEKVAESLRDLLLSERLIRTVHIDHAALWSEVAEVPLAFVDGGMASIGTLGAEPIAVRVGSYVVIPGRSDRNRESFTIEKQLVDELFEATPGNGIFDDVFDDVGKLRETARITVEAAGALSALSHPFAPAYVFLHGALVNPVSPYALEGFPDFTTTGIQRLLPPAEHHRTGRDRNFVSVYLRQLELLKAAPVTICGVVERASTSSIVTRAVLDRIKHSDSSPGPSVIEELWSGIRDYRLTDAVLFHALLDEGEYLAPVTINRNDIRRAPDEWKQFISRYPNPVVTYIRMGDLAPPIRCEFFSEPPAGFDLALRIIVHSCRLMPHYAFPAGLDIVDKFAKVPNWMSRPINNVLAVQVLKKALQCGNSAVLAEAKKLISGTARDWMFRPKYDS